MLNQPFFQVALPIMITMIAAAGISINNGRRHDRKRRMDDLSNRLGRVEDRLQSVEAKLTAVDRKVNIPRAEGVGVNIANA